METKDLAVNQRSPLQTQTPPLSPQLGFVVQFRVRVGQPATYFAGRVEHMVSGRSAHFHSPEELTEFFAQELGIGKGDG